ncbi:hypothetical protein BIZ78_gp163 [Erwinia phage vB_EamM_Caitlin]|uniref:hypothetical protein n=1 Tax=Erwinia phage vB_EamM_Caitlin TaxID=1883379 RepID=UPI00081C36E5|nr:hypothetical protein BIZ78_gp163 [Erwinia phage vB_EamM_Caitlin]ANZ48412.1 hypothetical protein CAITLIN_117 [Erwinia phage vB_EamM_Caitlin]
MKLMQYQSGDNHMAVQFNGKMARLDKVWEALKQFRGGLCDHSEHFLILSNTDRVLMYFNGSRSGRHFYIQGFSPLADQPFKQWKALQRELEVSYLELVTDSSGDKLKAQMQGLNLELVTKRVDFVVTDPDQVHFPIAGLQLQENSSLEEIAALCELAKKKMADAQDVLASAAAGAVDVVMRYTGSVLTSALFYSHLNDKMLVSEGFVSCYPIGSLEYAQEFIAHFRGMLERCARENKTFSIAMAAEANIPEYEGIEHEVRSYHYTFA